MERDVFSPDRFRAVFKDCELGIADTPPVFHILPDGFALGGGICRIETARRMTVTLGLAFLDRGFAALLDSRGRFAEMTPEEFAVPGRLVLAPEPDGGPVCGFPCARLIRAHGYGMLPDAGQRLILEFEIVPTEPGKPYMVRF